VPIYCLKCKKCSYETEILLYSEGAIASFKCRGCGVVGLWSKCPTTASLKRNGTYSYLEGLKK